MSYISEFGQEYAIPAEVLELAKKGMLFDMSWHNDACPSFATVQADSDDAIQEGAKVLWIEHPDFRRREIPCAARYGVTVMDDGWNVRESLYDGEDLNTALAFLLA